MKNKKQARFTLQNWFIGFIPFMLMFIVGFVLIADVNSNYAAYNVDINIANVSNNVTNAFDELNNASQGMKDAVLGSEVDESNTVDSLFQGAFSAIRFVGATFSIFGSLINVLSAELMIPGQLVALAIMAIVILVIMAIIFIVMRLST